MPSPHFRQAFLTWDSDAILAAAGSSAKLVQLIVACDLPAPRLGTVAMWRSRGKIPHMWLPICIYAVLKAERAKLSSLFKGVPKMVKDVDEDDVVAA